LTGKYLERGAAGRLSDSLDKEVNRDTLRVAGDLRTFAAVRAVSAAAAAIAFALLNERVASVLFGATTPEQLAENAKAVEVAAGLDERSISELRGISTSPT
jgi:aryl-alcohol dehydrogenase-like predicted oxidoreductase